MGLYIYGEETGHDLKGSYSTLHHTVRYLSLVYCGMPENIGTRPDGKKIDSFSYYMNRFAEKGSYFDNEKMSQFISSISMIGLYFPQINFHSDCDGEYTKDGKIDIENDNWGSGNSLKLLEELNLICNDNDIIEFCKKSDRGKQA